MTFEALQKSVGEWHRATFSPADINYRLARKLHEESMEFFEAVASESEGAKDEAADCLIVLMAWAERNNADLIGAASAKLEIVRARDQRKRDAERGIVDPDTK